MISYPVRAGFGQVNAQAADGPLTGRGLEIRLRLFERVEQLSPVAKLHQKHALFRAAAYLDQPFFAVVGVAGDVDKDFFCHKLQLGPVALPAAALGGFFDKGQGLVQGFYFGWKGDGIHG